jgi:LmbE family N-acetylglucosaminyl deacetylase
MQLNFRDERVLAIVAHPDDAELLCAGTLARARRDGAAIGIGVLCRGDKGQSDPAIENLAELRRGEMKAAAELLRTAVDPPNQISAASQSWVTSHGPAEPGVHVLEGGFGDGELFDTTESRGRVVELVRRFQPTLILAPSASDYHPDHRAASALAEAASWFCTSAGHKTESPAMARSPALWWMDNIEMIGFQPHVYIDVSDFIELKRSMLRCHNSQLARGERGDFSPLEEVMLRQCETRGAEADVTAAEGFRQHLAWKRIGGW